MGICASFIAEQFGCVGVTLEQPFKENANAPDPIVGWSPQKSVDFGHASSRLYITICKYEKRYDEK